eukprot:5341212-Amphidinium_carterae.1
MSQNKWGHQLLRCGTACLTRLRYQCDPCSPAALSAVGPAVALVLALAFCAFPAALRFSRAAPRLPSFAVAACPSQLGPPCEREPLQQPYRGLPGYPSKVKRFVVVCLVLHLCIRDTLAMRQPHMAEGASYFPIEEYRATLHTLQIEPHQP